MDPCTSSGGMAFTQLVQFNEQPIRCKQVGATAYNNIVCDCQVNLWTHQENWTHTRHLLTFTDL